MDKIGRFKRPCATIDEFEALAKRPTVRKFEAVELIQGLLPTRAVVSFLSDYAEPAKKLLKAFTDGELTDPTTPEKLVRWCNDNGVALPEEYVRVVIDSIFVLRRPHASAVYTDERIWEQSRAGRPKKKSGKVVNGLDVEIIKKARAIVLRYVEDNGELPYKKQVTKNIALKTGRSAKDIDRCYNIKTCITPVEFIKASRKWRRQYQANQSDDNVIPRSGCITP